LSIFGYNPT